MLLIYFLEEGQTHPTLVLFKVISLVTSKLKNIFKDPFSSDEISLFHFFNNYLLSAYYVLGLRKQFIDTW